VGISIVVGDSADTKRIQAEVRETITRERSKNARYSSNSPYPFGWCTYYASQKKGITTNYGDARYWPVNSDTPQVGAVMVTYESPRGHVSYTEAVDGYLVTVSEMNYQGWGRISQRTVDIRNIPLKGFML